MGKLENLELKYSLVNDDAKSTKNLKDSLQSLKTILEKNDDFKINVTGFNTITEQFKSINNEAKKFEKTLKGVSNLKLNIFSDATRRIDFKQQTQELNKLVGEIKKAQGELNKITTQIQKAKSDSSSLNMWKEKSQQKLDNYYTKGQVNTDEYLRYSRIIKEIKADSEDLKNIQKQIAHNISLTVDKQRNLNTLNKAEVKHANEKNRESEKQTQSLKEQERITKKIAEFQKLMSSKLNLGEKKFGNLMSGKDVTDIQKQVDSLSNMSFGSMSGLNDKKASIANDFNVLTNRITASKKAMDLTNRSATSLGSALQNAAQKFGVWSLVTVAYYKTVQAFREGLVVVKDMNTAMVDIQRVTNETRETYDEFSKSVSGIGRAFAKTGIEVARATTTFARMGYNLKEATEIAKEALLLSNVGDMGVEDASNSMISAVKGFDIPINKISELNDAMNELGNTMPITVGGLSEALQRSASVLSFTGNSYQESLAMIAAANGVVQNPEKIGNALKTISLRVAGSKDEETGEDYAEIVPKLEQDFARLGIQIQDTQGNLKSTYQVLIELGKAFENSGMSDLEKTNMLETISGKYNVNVAAAIVDNYADAEKALNNALNSTGSAQKENEKYLKSIEGKLSVLKNRAEEFWMAFIQTDEVKHLIDMATKLLEIMTKIVSTKIGRGTGFFVTTNVLVLLLSKNIVGMFGGFTAVLKLLNYNGKLKFFDNANQGLTNTYYKVDLLQKKLNSLNGSMNLEKENYTNAIQKSFDTKTTNPYNADQTQRVRSMARNTSVGTQLPKRIESPKLISQSGSSLTNEAVNSAKNINALNKSIQATRLSYIKTTASAVAFNTVIGLGVGLAVGALAAGILKIANYYNELKAKSEDVMATFAGNTNTIESNRAKVSELGNEYKTLSEKQNLTLEESERFKDVNNELAGIFPNLISYYDEAGNAVMKYSGNVAMLNAELDKQKQKERDKVIAEAPDIVKSASKEKQDVVDRINPLKTRRALLEQQLSAFSSKDNVPLEKVAKLKNLIADINDEIRISNDQVVALSQPFKQLADVVIQSKDNYKDLTEAQKASLESLKNSFSNGFKGTSTDFIADIDKLYEAIPSLSKSMIQITPDMSEADETKIKSEIEQIVKGLNLKIDSQSLNAFIEDLIAKAQSKADESPIEFSIKALNDDFDSFISDIKKLDEAIQKSADGYSYSYDEMQELVELYPELKKAVVRTADGYKIEESALKLSREAMIKNKRTHYDAEIEKTKTAFLNMGKRLGFIESEIKGIQTLGDAYAKAASMASKMGDSISVMGDLDTTVNDPDDTYEKYLNRKGVFGAKRLKVAGDLSLLNDGETSGIEGVMSKKQYEEFKKQSQAVVNYGKELNEINKLKGELDDISTGSILGGSPDKEKKDKTLDEIDVIDKYSNAIKELDLAIAKLQSTRDKLSKNSKEYKDNIKKELDLIREKKKLTDQEIIDNAKLLDGKVKMSDYVSSSTTVVSGSDRVMPVDGKITSVFGDKRTYGGNRKHEGLDIAKNEGSSIRSVASGVVTKNAWSDLGGWALSIKDEEGLVHYYAHMMEKAALKAGDKVNIGDVIGKVGSTGYGKEGTKGKFGSHLHYGVYKNGKAINPSTYLNGATTVNSDVIDKRNEEIKKYNEALGKQQSAFDKDIDLRTRRVELQKQEEEYLRSLAQLTIDYSDKQAQDLKAQNELLSLKQQVMNKDSQGFKDVEAQKVNNLVAEQLEYQRQAIEIKQLLQENERHMNLADGQNFLTGDMVDQLTEKLQALEKSYWETTVTIKESQLQESLQALEKYMENMTKAITPLENAIEGLKIKFELISDIDFIGRKDVTGDMFEATKNQLSMLKDQYRELADIQPETKEEAMQLADNLSGVADKIMNANRQMIEYKRQMDMLLVDEMSYSYKNDIGKLESVLGGFQHNLKMLDGGMMDGTDISFGIGMLPDVPKSLLEEKRKELDSMIDEQREYEEEILKIREMSFDEQEGKNQEFSEAIKQYMTGHYDELVSKLADSLGIQYDEMTDGQKAILDNVRTALFDTENAYASTWDSIVSKVTQALNTIKQAQAEAMYTYQNFDDDGKYLGVTTGKSGQSNKMDNAGKIVTETGQTWVKDKSGNWVQKYAEGTDGHRGGVALVGEEGEELAILPSGKSIMLGKSGAELVDLPAGTTVIPNDETKDLTKYLGATYKGSNIPKYAEGTLPKYSGGVLGSIVKKIVSSVGDTIAKAVKKASSGGSKSSSSTSSSTPKSMQFYGIENGMTAPKNVEKGKSILNTTNGKTYYQYANYDETGKFIGMSEGSADRANPKNGATHVVAANGKIYTTAFGNSIKERNATQASKTSTAKVASKPKFGVTSANPEYYKQEKSAHEKGLDKIRFDSFLTKPMAAEFKTYKSARDTNMASIKAEQEVIKKHFSDGGLRETIEDQIQNLVDKIDIQTAKDVEMQFKMSKDVLEQQKKLAEDYMKKTQDAYMTGINKGQSVESLRKLRDEFSDAQNEFQQIEEAIKDSIKSRYEYEFALMDKRMVKYKKQQDDIGFKINVLNSATDGKDFKQQASYNEQMVAVLKDEIQALNSEMEKFKKTQNTFSVGSFEWNLFEEQIKDVNDEIKDLNLSIVQTIANNKKLETDRLSKTFDTNNKQLEKDLFGGETSSEASREINKQKAEYEKFLAGIEKEYALDLLIRDLRKEEISDFDEQISLMSEKEKISRDEYTTLTKMIAIKKIENALDKAKNNKTIKELQKKDDGTWDFVNVADMEAIKNLEDQLIQAKIEMLNWNKELEFKTADLSIQEKLDFMDRLREIQQKALNEEYKESDEFKNDLEKLGLSLSDYGDWTEGIKDSIVDSNGNLTGMFDMMSTSFDTYTDSINALNARLEALLIALSVDKTINLNDALNGIKQFDTGGYTGGFNNGKLAVLHEKELVLNQEDTKNLLDTIKLIRGIKISDVVGNIKAKTEDVIRTIHEFTVPVTAVFPNAKDIDAIQSAINTLPEMAKVAVTKRV